MPHRLSRLLLALSISIFSFLNLPALGATEFFIAPQGNDQNPGTLEKPFATLEAARDAIRKLKQDRAYPNDGVTVWVRGGTYGRQATFSLNEQDSGPSETAPVIYSAYKAEAVHLSGGKRLTVWEQVKDPLTLDRLPAEARNEVFVADLSALGLPQLPDFNPNGVWTGPARSRVNGLWLCFKGKPMELACWPNEGYDPIRDIPSDSDGVFRGEPVNKKGRFYGDPERAKRWSTEQDLWCRGFFAVMYADSNHAVKQVDAASGLIEVAPPYHSYGYKKSKGGIWTTSLYKIANALSELDRPGEFKVDRQHGKLYFWPPSPIGNDDADIPVLGVPLLETKSASNIIFRGLVLELSRSGGALIEGGSNLRFEACTLRNLGDCAVTIKGGARHTVVGCDFSGLAGGGINVTAGDRVTLTPCNHLVENCHFHDLSRWDVTYNPAVNANGVGITVRNCLFHDMPHSAIMFSGNDHVIEYNEFHSTNYAVTESGAIYTGRSWSFAGNQIRYNYFHDIYGPDLHHGLAIHLDDAVSGVAIHGNIFDRMCQAIAHRGGRHVHVTNNLFGHCARAACEASYLDDPDDRMAATLTRFPYKLPPWSTKYPELVNTLEDNPSYPVGSYYRRNICLGGPLVGWYTPKGNLEKLKALVPVEDNFASPQNMADIKRDDDSLQLALPEQALKAVPGFERLPLGKIGLLKSGPRASWPVDNQIRVPPKVWRSPTP